MRKKRYADAFKKQLIALVAQGRTPEQLAREYEPTAQTIRNWVNEAQKQQPASELEKDCLIVTVQVIRCTSPEPMMNAS